MIGEQITPHSLIVIRHKTHERASLESRTPVGPSCHHNASKTAVPVVCSEWDCARSMISVLSICLYCTKCKFILNTCLGEFFCLFFTEDELFDMLLLNLGTQRCTLIALALSHSGSQPCFQGTSLLNGYNLKGTLKVPKNLLHRQVPRTPP